jgi:hypothetical protein
MPAERLARSRHLASLGSVFGLRAHLGDALVAVFAPRRHGAEDPDRSCLVGTGVQHAAAHLDPMFVLQNLSSASTTFFSIK